MTIPRILASTKSEHLMSCVLSRFEDGFSSYEKKNATHKKRVVYTNIRSSLIIFLKKKKISKVGLTLDPL